MERKQGENDRQLFIAKALLLEVVKKQGVHISPDKRSRKKQLKRLSQRTGVPVEELKPIILEITMQAVQDMLA